MKENATENMEMGYIGYQEMIADITSALESAGEVMTQLELPRQAEQAGEAAVRLKSHVFSVGIMGEFKRGKSTVINALLGEEIAPADVVPASATLNRITYGLEPRATIVYKDGHREEVPVDRIAEYVTKITEGAAATAELVDQAVVEYPCQFCQNNVEIIDTPGLNDDERMDAISEEVIPRLDAVVLVLSASSPFSKSEAEFVRNKLMTSDVTRLIVVVNRIDTIFSERDRTRLLESIREKIVREILDRMAAIHGEDSRIYHDTKSKLSDIRLYPLSAIQALIGRLENQPEMVEKSGILAFEERLRRLLTQERGVLEIVRVSGIITSLIAEGENAIKLRMSALEMSSEEFLKNQKEAEEKIRDFRNGKKAEMDRIRRKGTEIRKRMEGIVEEKYADLERRLNEYFSTYPVDVNAIESETGQKHFQNTARADLEKQVKQALSEYTEQINVFLRESIGDECVLIQEYVGSLANQITILSEKMQNSSVLGTAGVVGVDAMSNLLGVFLGSNVFSATGLGMFGLGGMIEGYRAAGAKGAVTGLVGGAAAGTMAGFALVGALGSVAFLPFALITGLAGTLGGKFLTSTIWRRDIQEKKAEEIRSDLKEAAVQSIRNLREQKLLENWAQEQVKTQIDGLMEQVEQESETMIAGMEDTLRAIAADIAKASQDKEQRMEDYRKLEQKLKGIGDRMVPILKRAEMAGSQTQQAGGV